MLAPLLPQYRLPLALQPPLRGLCSLAWTRLPQHLCNMVPQGVLSPVKPSPVKAATAAAAPLATRAAPPCKKALLPPLKASAKAQEGPSSSTSSKLRPSQPLHSLHAVVYDYPPGMEPGGLKMGARLPAGVDTPVPVVPETIPPYISDGPGSGRIDVIMGPMFAGKSTALINRVEAAVAASEPVAIVKSGVDQRYSTHWVVAHTGRCMRCHVAGCLREWRLREPAAYQGCKVLAIDEAQFFEDLVEFVTEAADVDGKHVVVAGLSGDYKRQPFGAMLQLVPLASSVTMLSATCWACERPAEFSLRVVAMEGQELVGGADKYRAACRRCYVSATTKQQHMQQHPDQQLVVRRSSSLLLPTTPELTRG